MIRQTQSAAIAAMLRRERIQIRGLVQGVGFRPHVYRTAVAHGLAGWVRNDGQGVILEAEGMDLDGFVAALERSLPPLGRIDSLERFEIPVTAQQGFGIVESSDAGTGSAAVPADAAICDRCLGELFDSTNRRYLHPFIACSDCGPRYSMTERFPYDRRNTTMADHPMCGRCLAEYEDPLGRRLHAEPIACHDCGPRFSHPVAEVSDMIRQGKIIALKGIGGFHLVCDGRNSDLIETLRERKKRSARPFALMMLNSISVEAELSLSGAARAELESWRRPVIVAERRQRCRLPSALAPGLSTLGVMLPYTGIHYLLFWTLAGSPSGQDWLQQENPTALLMTSANVSGDPILSDNDEAAAALAGIADMTVTHNRRICCASDDSVIRDADGTLVQLRRSRAHVPQSIALGSALPSTLALGAQLKNTVCAVRGKQAFLSAHLGDMESPATRRFGRVSLDSLVDQLAFKPEAIACDLHPDYASSLLAESLAERHGLPLCRVQHHHAHAASVLALSDWRAPALALTLDGHGLGTDGSSWGGELLRLDGPAMERLGRLRALPTPGGDRAAREPWRMAVATLVMLGRADEAVERFGDQSMAVAVAALAGSATCPGSSSAGRLFDAAAALLGLCRHVSFEAEAPMRLESQVRSLQALEQGYMIDDSGLLDFSALLDALADTGDPQRGAELFHGTVLAGLEAWVIEHATREGLDCVALSGGCFANRWLAAALPSRLTARGLRVLSGWDRLPPGDGGVSLGQAYVAALKMA